MQSAEIRSVNGLPTLFVDGRPEVPMLFFGNTEVAGHEDIVASEIRLAAAAGVHLHSVCTHLDVRPPADPAAGGRRDLSRAFQALDTAIGADPDACILLRVNLCLYGRRALAWEREHPGEAMRFAVAPAASGSGMVDEDGRWVEQDTMVSLASDEWLACAEATLLDLAEAVEAHPVYSRHLLGYHIAGAETGEWFHFQLRERGLDLSPANARGFRRFLAYRYGTPEALRRAWALPDGDGPATFDAVALPADLPGNDRSLPAERTLLTRPDDRRFIDYADYASDLVADRILRLARCGRAATRGRRLIVFFYGYHFDLYDARTGHFQLNRILASPDIDALSSPICYTDRNEGGVGALMGPVDSVHRHGKLWFVENDLRTFHVLRSGPYGDWVPSIPDLPTLREVYRREAGTLLAHGTGSWHMDLFAKGWHALPEIWQEIASLKKAVEDWRQQNGPLSPETVLLVDEAGLSLSAHAEALGMNLLYRFRLEFYRAGLRFGLFTLEDFLDGRVPSARLAFLAGGFALSRDTAVRLAQRLREQACGLVWMHGPGRTADEDVAALLGFGLRRVEGPMQSLAMAAAGPSTLAEALSARGAGFQPPAMGDAGRGGGVSAASPAWTLAEPDPGATVLAAYAEGPLAGYPAFVCARVEGTRRWFFGGMAMSAGLVREVARSSGIPVLLETPDTCIAGNRTVTIHSDGSPGIREVARIRPGPVLELHTGRRFEAGEPLRLEMPPHSTRTLVFLSEEEPTL